MAVPGPIGVPTSEGPNMLLYHGARPVRSVSDVLFELGLPELQRSPGAGPRKGSGAPSAPLDAGARELLETLRRGAASRDELLRLGRWSPEDLSLHLVDLELTGRVAVDRDGRYWLDPSAGR